MTPSLDGHDHDLSHEVGGNAEARPQNHRPDATGLHVDYHDTGCDRHRFGFVYFNDETRVAYAIENGPIKVHPENWDDITDVHVRKASEYLKQEGVLK